MIEAAKEADGVYAIGADMDQDSIAPGKILTSILKRIDVAVFEAIQDVQADRFKKGHYMLGIAEDATGLTDMTHTRGVVSSDALEAVAGAQAWIRDGGQVPETAQALELANIESYARGW